MHERIDAYWTPRGYVPRDQATETQAAVLLLADFWRFERGQGQEHYHRINQTCELSSSVMRTIGRWVWPEGA